MQWVKVHNQFSYSAHCTQCTAARMWKAAEYTHAHTRTFHLYSIVTASTYSKHSHTQAFSPSWYMKIHIYVWCPVATKRSECIPIVHTYIYRAWIHRQYILYNYNMQLSNVTLKREIHIHSHTLLVSILFTYLAGWNVTRRTSDPAIKY